MLTIYKNGNYIVEPIVSGFLVRSKAGAAIQRFTVEDVEKAIETVDDMAYTDGILTHVS